MEGELIPELNINDEIKSKKLLVIAPDGVQIGAVSYTHLRAHET